MVAVQTLFEIQVSRICIFNGAAAHYLLNPGSATCGLLEPIISSTPKEVSSTCLQGVDVLYIFKFSMTASSGNAASGVAKVRRRHTLCCKLTGGPIKLFTKSSGARSNDG